MAILYHGTSSKFAETIISNGLGTVTNNNNYAEIRDVLSKYINPDILTDDFFDKYAKFIGWGGTCRIDFRKKQSLNGIGPFVTFYDKLGAAKYRSAPEYAKETTKWGCGEFEKGIIIFLNTIEKKLLSFAPDDNPDEKEVLTLLKNNARKEYVLPDGRLKFCTNGDYKTDFPIIFKLKVPDNDVVKKDNPDNARTKTLVKPEQIVGVAFLPPFYFHFGFDNYVPRLNFLSKQDFLTELNNRKNARRDCKDYEIKESVSGHTVFICSFPTEHLACAQLFESGKMLYASFFSRVGHLNTGWVAVKEYEKGIIQDCNFYHNPFRTEIVFQHGYPYKYTLFENTVSVDEMVAESSTNTQFITQCNGKLDDEQLFILGYEKQPTKPKANHNNKKTLFVSQSTVKTL